MENTKERIISVSGNARLEIKPDEITLQINYEEYEENDKLINLKQIEKQLLNQLSTIGILSEKITIDNSFNINYNKFYRESDEKEYKNSNILIILEDKEFDIIGELFHKLKDCFGIKSVEIINTKNKNIDEYTKQVKINAVKSAKDKAEYLLDCLGNKLGNIITLEDNDYQIDNHIKSLNHKLLSKQSAINLNNFAELDNTLSNIKISNIILTAHISAEFEIL